MLTIWIAIVVSINFGNKIGIIKGKTIIPNTINTFEENNDIIKIESTIYVERESQKAIVLGHKGVAMKSIGIAARRSIQNIFKKKVFLSTFIKVSRDWRNQKSQLKKFGYT